MKKIISFLMLMAVMTTAMAQLSTEKVYRLRISDEYHTGEPLYATFVNTTTSGKTEGAMMLKYETTETTQIFTLENGGTDGWFYIKCKNDKYISQGFWNPHASDESNTLFKIENVSGNIYTIYQERENDWKGYLGLENTPAENQKLYINQGDQKKIQWIFEEVTELTYIYKFNEAEIYTETVYKNGENLPTPHLPYYGLTAQAPTLVEGTTYDVNCVSSLPFEFADSYANIEHWYSLQFNGKYISYNSGNASVIPFSDEIGTDAYAFAFVGNPVNGFKIYNHSLGENYILRGQDNPYTGSNGQKAYLYMDEVANVEGTNNKGLFYPFRGHADGQFALASKNNSNLYENIANGGYDGLAYWNNLNEISDLKNATFNTRAEASITATEVKIVEITSANAATLFSADGLEIPEGVTAKYVKPTENEGSEGTLKYTELDGIIPANTAVVLTGEADSYAFKVTTAEVDAVTDNALFGYATATNVESSANIYALANKSQGVGFYPFKGDTYAAGKAYLNAVKLNPSNEARFFNIFNEDNETAIESIEGTEGAENAAIYDLSGRRLQSAQKGLYIMNGRIVIK